MVVSSPIVVLRDGFLMMCGRWSGMELECRRALPGETRADGLVPVPLPLQPWV